MSDKLILTCPNCGASTKPENEQPQPREHELITVFRCESQIRVNLEVEKPWEWEKECTEQPKIDTDKCEGGSCDVQPNDRFGIEIDPHYGNPMNDSYHGLPKIMAEAFWGKDDNPKKTTIVATNKKKEG